MIPLQQFAERCRMRPDFSDQIQVRYHHPDGEKYDTWVSGEEVLQRLKSDAAEKRLRGLSRLDWNEVREAGRRLPGEGKKRMREDLRDRLADKMEDAIGDSIIGDSLSDAVRGRERVEDPYEVERARWRSYLQDKNFRAGVLELAWLNLKGSLPEEPEAEPDDWI